MITPNDIETKVFSYSVRGYNKREVDEFLDQIMIDYQALLDQNAKMLERVHVLQKQVTEAKDPARMTRDAKRLMNDISASAEQQAQVIIKNARHDAENIVRNAKDSTSQADEDAERLRRKVEKFKLRYKQMLEDEIERMDDSSEDLLDDLRKDFFPGYLYGENKGDDFTKVAKPTPVDDIIAELPDVEPEDSGVAEEPTAEIPAADTEDAFAEEAEEPVIETYDSEAGAETESDEEEEYAEAAEDEESEEEPAESEDTQIEETESLEGTEEVSEPGEVQVEESEDLEETQAEETDDLEENETEEKGQGDFDGLEEAPQNGDEESAGSESGEDSYAAYEETEEDDPLIARAKAENVDIDGLPGFRSSKEDTVVIRKKASEETVDITDDIAEEAAPAQDDLSQAAEKARELKETATKFVSDFFSKKDK